MSLTEIQLLQVAEQLGAEWESLAIHLGYTAPQIYQIKTDNPDTVVNAIHRMLCGWLYRQQAGSDCKGSLASGLHLCGRQDLANLVRTGLHLTALDVELCQRQLREHYLQSLCKIPRHPGDTETCVNMDEIYTNLSILYEMKKPCAPIKIPLISHNEIFTREDNGMLPKRTLVLGRGGSGKSTLLAKFAYDWATRNADSALKDLPLLFVLNMRGMDPDTNLENAIIHQLLPKDTNISEGSLLHYMKNNPSNFMILLDSYDEFSRGERLGSSGTGNVLQLLSNTCLTSCRVLVTSRHWRASDFSSLTGLYTKVDIDGFSEENVRGYVMKYFFEDERSGEQLCEYIAEHDLFGIASFPLMAQLLCLLWTSGKKIPNKIGELYTVILQLLYDHFKSKGTSPSTTSLNEMIIQLGEVACFGLWPPENKLVFSQRQMVEIASAQCVEDGCKAGIISQEKVASNASNKEQCITFFHKSGQEKCAGDYLAHLAETNIDALLSKLRTLDSVSTCLSVQMVLRFASGSSQIATKLIIQKLIQVFKSELIEDILDYFENNLEDAEKAKIIQELIELCLICNYESGSTDKFSSLLSQLFPSRRLQFMGLSPYTSLAAGYFLSNIEFRNIIVELKIIELPRTGLPPTFSSSKIVENVYRSAQTNLQTKSIDEIRNLHSQYIDRHKDVCGMLHFTESVVGSEFSYGLSCIELWEYFKTWNSTRSEIKLDPILNAVENVELDTLDLSGVHLRDNGQKIVSIIQQGHLSSLTQLILSETGFCPEQMHHMVTFLQQHLPKLKVFDISENVDNNEHILSTLSENLSTMSLQELKIRNMNAPSDDMTALSHKLQNIGAHLLVFESAGNDMDDETGMAMSDTLPHLHNLNELDIDVNGLGAKVHKKLLMKIRELTKLRTLRLYFSPYPDDLLIYISMVIPSLPMLTQIYLESDIRRKPDVLTTESKDKFKKILSMVRYSSKSQKHSIDSIELRRSSWKSFMSSLELRSTQWNQLYMIGFKLHTTDLRDLIDLWTRSGTFCLGYTRSLWPVELEIPQSERLDLR